MTYNPCNDRLSKFSACLVQVSGLNLLKYKAGSMGAPCYHRYLHGVYELIHKTGGGVAYYGTVYQSQFCRFEVEFWLAIWTCSK